jgi:hypothetical protein
MSRITENLVVGQIAGGLLTESLLTPPGRALPPVVSVANLYLLGNRR